MTNKLDIDNLARECAGEVNRRFPSAGGAVMSYSFTPDQLTAYTRAVMEECAQRCAENAKRGTLNISYDEGWNHACRSDAAAIREMKP